MKNIQISHLIKRISLNIQQQMRNFTNIIYFVSKIFYHFCIKLIKDIKPIRYTYEKNKVIRLFPNYFFPNLHTRKFHLL